MTTVQYAQWLVPSGSNIVPLVGFASAYAGASVAESAALQAGTTIEQVGTAQYPSSFSLATIEADLLSKYTAAQTALTVAPNPIQWYGTYYDGSLLSWTSQSLSLPPNLTRQPGYGSTYVTLTLDNYAAVASESLTTMTINRGGTVTTATEYTVTTGKVFVVQSMSFCLLSNTGSISGRVRLRAGTTVGTSSGILCTLQTAAAANLFGAANQSFANGIQIVAGQQLGITQIISSTAANISVTVAGYEF